MTENSLTTTRAPAIPHSKTGDSLDTSQLKFPARPETAQHLAPQLYETRALSRAEQVKLGQEIRSARDAGDLNLETELVNKFVMHNMGLVHSISLTFRARGLAREDLVQAGTIGCRNAVLLWKPESDVAFSTYASFAINRAIKRTLTNESHLIRVPASSGPVVAAMIRSVDAINAAQVSKETGISEETVQAVVKARTALPVNLEDPEAKNALKMPSDQVALLEALVDKENLALLKPALEKLAPRTRRIIELRFGLIDGEERTLKECGLEFGISRERARKIIDKGVEALEHILLTHVRHR